MKKKIIVVSGYFNPLHRGHIEYFHKAKAHGNLLFVIVNNDYQRELKGSVKFMDEDEREIIIKELKIVDKTIISLDTDKTVCKTLKKISEDYSKDFKILFANGGDQNNSSIPEKNICDKHGIELIDGLGNKIQSSSWILKNKQ